MKNAASSTKSANKRFDRNSQLRLLESRGRSSSGLCDLPKNPYEIPAHNLATSLRITVLQQTRRDYSQTLCGWEQPMVQPDRRDRWRYPNGRRRPNSSRSRSIADRSPGCPRRRSNGQIPMMPPFLAIAVMSLYSVYSPEESLADSAEVTSDSKDPTSGSPVTYLSGTSGIKFR